MQLAWAYFFECREATNEWMQVKRGFLLSRFLSRLPQKSQTRVSRRPKFKKQDMTLLGNYVMHLRSPTIGGRIQLIDVVAINNNNNIIEDGQQQARL